MLLPAETECVVGGKTVGVKIETDYPHRHFAKITVHGKTKVKVRIPAWAERVTLDGQDIRKTQYLTLSSCGGERTFELEYHAEPKLVSRPHGMKCAQWGPLVFALPREAQYKMFEYERGGVERKYPYCDYELRSDTPWEYGFASDKLNVEYHDGDEYPFSSKNPRVTLTAELMPIKWGLAERYRNVAAPTPKSRKPVGVCEKKTLYPYGSAKLRVTEMPVCHVSKEGKTK